MIRQTVSVTHVDSAVVIKKNIKLTNTKRRVKHETIKIRKV